MRKLALTLLLAALLLGMVVIPAFAAIHPIASSECAADNASDVANGQNPPGQVAQGAPGPENSIPNSGGNSTNGNSGADNGCPNG